MKQIKFKPTERQEIALRYLDDNKTEEILFGGGAGGGKSLIGCFWLVMNCMRYPGTRWLVGRAELKRLKQSTLKTLFEILGSGKKGIFKFQRDIDYKYNAMEGAVIFPKFNNSEIILQDMKQNPSDPDFDTLGSTEYTGAFLDEISEIPIKAKQILLTRLRYKIDEYGIIGKILYCTNPCKHWAYYEFYKPNKNEELINTRQFIQALAKDNPHIPKTYLESLKRADKVTKERLLYGNWEYDDDPTKLFNYDSIIDLFTNDAQRGNRYCVVDVAGYGRDKTVIGIWDGLFLEKVIIKDNITDKELDDILIKEKIPRSKCLVDEGGVGFGAVNNVKGIKGFVSNARPITKKKETDHEKVLHNYKNLKAQCWFELANYVNSGMIGITRSISTKAKELLIEDLEQIKQKDPGRDAPLSILTKDELKESLGRSTDVGDMLMMRMYFILESGDLVFDFIKPREIPVKSKEESDEEEKQRLEELKGVDFGPKTANQTDNNI